jgi:hypothetical protein
LSRGAVDAATHGEKRKQNAVLKLCPLPHLFHVLLVLLNHPALRPHSIFQLTNRARLFVHLLPHCRPGTLHRNTNTLIHSGRAHFVLMQGPQAQTQQRQQAGTVPAQEQFLMSKCGVVVRGGAPYTAKSAKPSAPSFRALSSSRGSTLTLRSENTPLRSASDRVILGSAGSGFLRAKWLNAHVTRVATWCFAWPTLSST